MSGNNGQVERIVCIDRLRGLIIFNMLFFQCAEKFGSLWFIGQFASHDADVVFNILPNMTIADIGQPLFIFVIAMTYIPSFKRRMAVVGRKKAYFHFIIRYLAILGFGGCLRAIENISYGDREIITFVLLFFTVLTVIAAVLLLILSLCKKDNLIGKSKNILLGLLSLIGLITLTAGTVNEYLLFWLVGDYGIWGVLQALGGIGLLMLLFVEAPIAVRSIAAALLFGLFTFIHSLPYAMLLIDIDVQGGALGLLSWGAMLLVFTVMADLFYRDREAKKAGVKGIKANSYIIGMLVLAVIGVFGSTMVLNKGSVSPGYVLVNLPICSFIFWLFSLFDKWNPKFKFLQWWGHSPILMFLLMFFTNDVFLSLAVSVTEWSLIPALLYVIVVHALITWFAYFLYSKKITVKV